MAEINAFNDVPALSEPNSVQQVGGNDYLSSVSGLNIGAGNQVMMADPFSGWWIGGKTFASAPFGVTLDGVLKATGAVIAGYALDSDLSDLSAAALLKDNTTQILGGVIKVGGNNVIIDGVNKRIILNDGTTDRIIIGNL